MNTEDRCKLTALLEQRARTRRRRTLVGEIVISLMLLALLSSPMWLEPLMVSLGVEMRAPTVHR